MSVYFVQPTDGGPIKIGCSVNVPKRIKQLESLYGVQLTVLALLPGHQKAERLIHEKFSHLRLGNTEQFQPQLDLLAFIGLPVLSGDTPAAVEAMQPISNMRPIQMQDDDYHLARMAAATQARSISSFLSALVREHAKPVILENSAKLQADEIKLAEPEPPQPGPKARPKGRARKGGRP